MAQRNNISLSNRIIQLPSQNWRQRKATIWELYKFSHLVDSLPPTRSLGDHTVQTRAPTQVLNHRILNHQRTLGKNPWTSLAVCVDTRKKKDDFNKLETNMAWPLQDWGLIP